VTVRFDEDAGLRSLPIFTCGRHSDAMFNQVP
jgi:hypothetical protein